ncbi:MAG: hypothetical protein RL088_1013 [Verrucomicrobiota bacterium]
MKAAFLAIACLLTVSTYAAPPILREAGAIYLDDFGVKAVRLAAVSDATVYSLLNQGRYLGVIGKGRPLELLAVSEKGLRVRGMAQQGQVSGWVDAATVTPLKPEFIESLRANAKRKAEVDALIAKNEVGLNMTYDEVSASLGKAQKKTSKLDAGGRKETWEFVRYTRVPQQTTGYDRSGRLVESTVWVKVPSGKLVVTFENNLVTGLEQTEGTTDVQAPVRVIPAPIIVLN